MKLIDISIIIVSYNDLNYITKCIDSIYTQTSNLNKEIIVIDNHPSKEVFQFLKSKYQDILVKSSPQNLGYAKGNNLGIKLAKGEFIFIINADVVLHPACIQNLYSYCKNHPKSICMPKILLADGKRINTYGNKLSYLGISWCGNYLEPYKESNNDPEASKIYFPSGAAMFLRKKDFLNLGGFNDLFFMYLEDTELGLRAFYQNYEIFLIHRSIVFHDYNYSKNPLKFYHYEKNRLILLLEFFSNKTLLLILFPILILEVGMLYYFTTTKQLSIKLNSYKYIIRNLDSVLKLRKRNKMKKKIKDKDLFKILEKEIVYEELNFPLVTKVLNPIIKLFFKISALGI